MSGKLGRVPPLPGRFGRVPPPRSGSDGRVLGRPGSSGRVPGSGAGRVPGRLTCPGSGEGRFGIEGRVTPFPPFPSPPPRPPPPPGREICGGFVGRGVGRLVCGGRTFGRLPPRFGELGRVAGEGREIGAGRADGAGREAGAGREEGAGRDMPPPPPGRPPPRPRALSSLVPQHTLTANTSVAILRNMGSSSRYLLVGSGVCGSASVDSRTSVTGSLVGCGAPSMV